MKKLILLIAVFVIGVSNCFSQYLVANTSSTKESIAKTYWLKLRKLEKLGGDDTNDRLMIVHDYCMKISQNPKVYGFDISAEQPGYSWEKMAAIINIKVNGLYNGGVTTQISKEDLTTFFHYLYSCQETILKKAIGLSESTSKNVKILQHYPINHGCKYYYAMMSYVFDYETDVLYDYYVLFNGGGIRNGYKNYFTIELQKEYWKWVNDFEDRRQSMREY